MSITYVMAKLKLENIKKQQLMIIKMDKKYKKNNLYLDNTNKLFYIYIKKINLNYI